MINDIGNYASHARYWDWGGHDRTEEHEYWVRYSAKYESDYYPPKTFYPLTQVYPDIKVWKTGDTRNDAETGRCYISQTFYAEDKNGNVESFDHAFYLQSYYREEWLAVYKECGFDVIGEYGSREVESWQSGGGGFRIFEAVKSTAAKYFTP